MAETIGKPGWPKYGPDALRKVNSLREAASLVQITSAPILDKGQVLFSTAASAHSEPRSCYNCHFYNEAGGSCQLVGPAIRVEKFTYPAVGNSVSKPIEYWPVCGMWDYGAPNSGRPSFKEPPFDDPDSLGLGFVNAPEVGLPHGGTCCGGAGGGDDCDNYMVSVDDKRITKTGFCRVLQIEVGNSDCCTAWKDDDWVPWQEGQKILEDLGKKKAVASGPNPLLPK